MPTQEELIAGLREYISKNKFIPEFFKKLDSNNRDPEHERALSDLKVAIADGNPSAAIFQNQYCSLYLIYLMEKSDIPFWQGITAYFYCLMMMQFTDAQPLLERDEMLHRIQRPFEVDCLTQNGVVTPAGKTYLAEIKAQYAQYPELPFNEAKIIEAALKGSVIDNWLLSFKYFSPSRFQAGMRIMANTIAHDLLFIGLDDYGLRLTVPSVALMIAFIKPTQGEMILFKPAMGRLGIDTLQYLHTQKHCHPLALYSPWAMTSVASVHGIDCGPIMAFLHDVIHTFWMNIFTAAEREIIYNIAETLKNCTIERDEQPGLKLFETYKTRVIFKLLDFNFSKMSDMPKARSEWLPVYLMKAFGAQGKTSGVYASLEASRYKYPWMLPEDDMLYCLGRLSASGEPWASLYRSNMDIARSEAQRDLSVLGRIQQVVETQNKGETMHLPFTFSFFGAANKSGALKVSLPPPNPN